MKLPPPPIIPPHAYARGVKLSGTLGYLVRKIMFLNGGRYTAGIKQRKFLKVIFLIKRTHVQIFDKGRINDL